MATIIPDVMFNNILPKGQPNMDFSPGMNCELVCVPATSAPARGQLLHYCIPGTVYIYCAVTITICRNDVFHGKLEAERSRTSKIQRFPNRIDTPTVRR